MRACQNCGQMNAADAVTCSKCGQPLGADIPPPRLLAQIQGLIPPEPIISTGRRTAPAAQDTPDLALDEALAATAAITAAAVVSESRDTQEMEPVQRTETVEKTTVTAVATSESRDTQEVEPVQRWETVEKETVEMAAAAAASQAAGSNGQDLPPPARFVTMSEPEPEPPPPWSPALLLIAGAMLLAILIGQFLPPASAIFAPRRPDVELAYSFIEILPPGARVLLAWDYEPTVQGEMQLLAQPILNHLVQKRARLANISLRPTGPAVAAESYAFADQFLPLSAQIARPMPVEFGFVPGDAAALQALALAPAAAVNLPEESVHALGLEEQDVLDEFQLIIEFSAETAATQEWVEQIAARQRIPLVVVASGAVGPALRPYQQTGQIAALVEGYSDALAYEALLGQEDGPAAASQNPLTLALLVVLGATLLGVILPRRGDPNEDDDG